MTVVAGEVEGQRSPIPTFQELMYVDIRAKAGTTQEIAVDSLHELAVYVCKGEITIGDKVLKEHDLGKLSAGDRVKFEATTDAIFVLIGGEPLPEPTVIYWNFITDTLGEAKQRLIDWEEGKFPPVSKYRKISSIGDEGIEERVLLM